MSLSRRKFLGQASCAAIGSTTALSTLVNLFSVNTAAARPAKVNNDYKALVCILLAGGHDSFNMLMPRDATRWNQYNATRSGLAIPRVGGTNNSHPPMLAINPTNAGSGKQYGVHPSFSGIKNLFENGQAAFLSNVGTLAVPIANRTQYRSSSYKKPLGLFSHSDQIQQWQTSVPRDRQAVGWGGRMADVMHDLHNNANISMNISLSGKNVFQAGNTMSEYSIKSTGNGAVGLEAIPWRSNAGFLTNIRDNAVESMIAKDYANLLQSSLSDLTQNSIDAQEQFSNAIGALPPLNTTFSDHYLSQNMRMAAKTIAAHDGLGMNRQTFFMTFGGWDHHDEVINNQLYMYDVLSRAISEFYTALQEIGMENDVTTFTISDFGRTLTSNGNGSDHAWGGNQLVVGGAVKGKKIYGSFPDLGLDYNANPLNVNQRGSLIPTTSVDEYFAELALWFGVPSTQLANVLPNIGNFYSGSGMPIGFMDMNA
ncbi:MAG: DUF1501 domain-containing protein [Bacteroidota bacterium]